MAYIKQNWVGSENPLEGDPGSTPLSDEALDHLETQYDEAVDYVDAAVQDVRVETMALGVAAQVNGVTFVGVYDADATIPAMPNDGRDYLAIRRP